MSFNFKGSNTGATKRGGFSLSGGEPPEVEESDSLEVEAANEFSTLESEYVKRRKAEDARRIAATDSEYWFAVCFRSREDKDKFLRKIKAKPRLHGDKYIDGYALAKLLGITMED